MLVIGENGTILKTPLVEKTSMNYQRLNLYLNWLELNDFVNVSGQKIALTENGIRFRSRCLELIKA